nr:retrovirus-related Pol polyprotein [Tanacetum cinerariifolium]
MIKITKHKYSKPLQRRQHQARMSSNQDLNSWMKETSTLGEIVSLYFIKSNKNVVSSKEVIILVRDSFSSCLSHLNEMLKRYEDTNLVLNWEKCHFMVKEGIVLNHKIPKFRIKVDRAKIDVIAKFPHPTSVKAFNTLKKKLTEALILVAPDWDLPFEIMCDASDSAIGAKNLTADHLSRLENPHQGDLEKKEIKETFPLETLTMISSDSDSSTSWASTLWAPSRLLKGTSDHRKLQLNDLNEIRDQAYENYVIYKERTKKLHDYKIKNRIFIVGDQVLLFNPRLKIFSGKLKTRWSGLFTITQVFLYVTLELSQLSGPNFKVNGNRVKHYFRGDIPFKVIPIFTRSLWTNKCRDRVKLCDSVTKNKALHGRFTPTMIEASRVRYVVPFHMSFTSFVCK